MKKLGLALGGGAVRGLAHVGVLKALIKHQIPIDYITGCSIGAWVGAHFALYQDIDKLEALMLEKKKEKLLSFLEPSLVGGLIKGDKLEKLFDTWLNGASFSDLQIPLNIVAIDLVKGEQIVFKTGRLATAIHASVAIPGVFKPLVIKGKVLADGGICNPVPDDLVRELGAEVVLAVNLDNFQKNPNFNTKKTGVADILVRTTEMLRYFLAQYSMNNADIIIQPPLAKYSSWREYFIKDIGHKIIKIGEKETEKIIPLLKKKLK